MNEFQSRSGGIDLLSGPLERWETEAHEQVRLVISAALNPRRNVSAQGRERRRWRRVAFPYLLRLLPLSTAEIPSGSELTVVGRHLSEHGLNFYHREPLPARKVAVWLSDDPETTPLLLDVSWCRFIRDGWYEIGGRFQGALPELAGARAG